MKGNRATSYACSDGLRQWLWNPLWQVCECLVQGGFKLCRDVRQDFFSQRHTKACRLTDHEFVSV